ncbi:MAG: hypothetical protein V9F00_05810 [Nocardioides sp.]
MQTETILILIVGLISLSMIRVIVTMVGREYKVDHSAAQATDRIPSRIEATTELAVANATPRLHAVRGTGRNRHLFYLTDAEASSAS